MTHKELQPLTKDHEAITDFAEFITERYGHEGWNKVALHKLQIHRIHHLIEMYGDLLCKQVLPVASEIFNVSEDDLMSEFNNYMSSKSANLG